MENRQCERCKGTGRRFTKAFTYTDSNTGRQTHYPDRDEACYACKGVGAFPEPDVTAIIAAIKGRKGLCSKRPADPRAYYVWRNARFHGGADVTMPMGAMMEVAGDPWCKELDAIVDAVAKRVFGTDLAAAHRWGRAMGTINRDMPGLPDSAYSGGRVADADKPEEEAHELI
jgi:hypothetical protein